MYSPGIDNTTHSAKWIGVALSKILLLLLLLLLLESTIALCSGSQVGVQLLQLGIIGVNIALLLLMFLLVLLLLLFNIIIYKHLWSNIIVNVNHFIILCICVALVQLIYSLRTF